HFSHLGRPALGGLRIDVRFHHVVVMALNAVEAELLVFPDLGGKGHLFPRRRTKRIRARADVPRAEGETIGGLARIGGHESPPPKMQRILGDAPSVFAPSWNSWSLEWIMNPAEGFQGIGRHRAKATDWRKAKKAQTSSMKPV